MWLSNDFVNFKICHKSQEMVSKDGNFNQNPGGVRQCGWSVQMSWWCPTAQPVAVLEDLVSFLARWTTFPEMFWTWLKMPVWGCVHTIPQLLVHLSKPFPPHPLMYVHYALLQMWTRKQRTRCTTTNKWTRDCGMDSPHWHSVSAHNSSERLAQWAKSDLSGAAIDWAEGVLSTYLHRPPTLFGLYPTILRIYQCKGVAESTSDMHDSLILLYQSYPGSNCLFIIPILFSLSMRIMWFQGHCLKWPDLIFVLN